MNNKQFHKLKTWESVISIFTVMVVCTIMGNSCFTGLMVHYSNFDGDFLPVSKYWIYTDLVLLFIAGRYIFLNVGLNIVNMHRGGFFTLLIFPVLWMINPCKIPRDYLSLRKTDSEGFIISDKYCYKECSQIQEMKNNGYKLEGKYYSWHYTAILNRNLENSNCCSEHSKDGIELFFGIQLIAELTFEYFPTILILTIFLLLYDYYKYGDLLSIQKFYDEDFNIRKFVVFGIILLSAIIIYNLYYMDFI